MLSLQAQQAVLASAGSSLGSGQWVAVPGTPSAVPVVPPAALSPAQVQSIQDQLSLLQQSGSLPLPPGSGSLPSLTLPAMPAAAGAGAHLPSGSGGASAKATKARHKRPYKPPEVVQAERKQKAEVQVCACVAAEAVLWPNRRRGWGESGLPAGGLHEAVPGNARAQCCSSPGSR